MANRLFGEAGMRELDRRAMALPGLGGGRLMERAGAALLETLSEGFPRARTLGVLCGPGNNGGDGFVLARLAAEAGWAVTVHAAEPGGRRDSDGARARRAWTEGGGDIRPLDAFSPDRCEVWADCLFGIGLGRPLEAPYAGLIEALNRSGVPVLAADVPSGVHIDTGSVCGVAVRARLTVTMIADKFGLCTGAALDHAGRVRVAALDLPESLFEGVSWLATRVMPEQAPRGLPSRRPTAHKGDFGHLLVVGGAPGYSGASRLTAAAALRAGAGRVTLVTHPDHAALANLDRPELMVRPAQAARDMEALLATADAVAVGPGLDQQAWGRALWPTVADWHGPLVVDADALNLLAQAPRQRQDWVLTPHPGEAGRLLGSKAATVNADRLAALRELRDRYGGTVLLKGAGTLVAPGPQGMPACITGGHPGMATAGMGDVLTGIIGALRAQGLDAGAAAVTGAAWHVAAAQLAAQRLGGQRGLLAGDVIEALPASGAGAGA
ncbi:NAD(P)H-hydrate dehydratase [Thioalkalivibrio sp.]|uniref:NAD(P)H-hydrate dehydratase n=1 Tax=Thioalkalivibrio sp. TaxID=2093813 RepID=UPI0039771AE0